MIIILAVVLSISAIFYSELKIVKNIGNSVVAFYTAESGIEETLYIHRVVLADDESSVGSGLCSICGVGACSEYSIDGCSTESCGDCEIVFDGSVKSSVGGGARTYGIVAKLITADGETSLNIDSIGTYKDVKRAINLQAEGSNGSAISAAPILSNWIVTPNSVSETEESISISTDARSPKNLDSCNLSSVVANIKTGYYGPIYETIALWCSSGDRYEGFASGLPIGPYYVDIRATDADDISTDSGNIQ
jgi:hypothetical protein